MSWTSALAIYFILWWLVLFAVLPWGAQSAHEAGQEVPEGHAPSAPMRHGLRKKFLVTTLLSGLIFAVILIVAHNELISLDDFPKVFNFRTFD